MTATVVIPYGGKQVFESVENVIDSVKNLHKDPVTAGTTVIGSTLTSVPRDVMAPLVVVDLYTAGELIIHILKQLI